MYCHTCGKPNPAHSNFCQDCGAAFTEPSSMERVYPAPVHTAISDHIDKTTRPYPYVISIWKLLILSTRTLGFFNIYWFYRHWKSFYAVSNDQHGRFYIVAASLFGAFSSFSLFKRIAGEVRRADPGSNLQTTALSTLYLISIFLWRLPGNYWLVGMLSVVPLLLMQNAINCYWEGRYGDRLARSAFGEWNFAVVLVGSVFVAGSIYGAFQ